MNPLNLILSLVKGKNIYDTASKVLVTLAGFLSGMDPNKTGNDDLAAGVMVSVAKGLDAYAVDDNNEHGNIVDAVIAGLQEYRRQAVDLGLITDKPGS